MLFMLFMVSDPGLPFLGNVEATAGDTKRIDEIVTK